MIAGEVIAEKKRDIRSRDGKEADGSDMVTVDCIKN